MNNGVLVSKKSVQEAKVPARFKMQVGFVAGFLSTCLTVVNHSLIWLTAWVGAMLLIKFETRLKSLLKPLQSKVKAWQVMLFILIAGFVVFQMVEPALSQNYGFLDPVEKVTSNAFTQSGAKNGAAMSATIFGFAISFIAITAVMGAAVGVFLNRQVGVPLVEAFGIAIGVAMFIGICAMFFKGLGLSGA